MNNVLGNRHVIREHSVTLQEPPDDLYIAMFSYPVPVSVSILT